MDLIESFKRTVELLRSNLVLFLPPLIFMYLINIGLALAAFYIFAPILIMAANSSAPLSILGGGVVVVAAIIVILAVVSYAYVLAGWAGMNKNVALTEKTVFNDFWAGAKACWGRILSGIIILAVIYIVLAIVGVLVSFAVFLPIFTRLVPSGIAGGTVPPILTNPIEAISQMASQMISRIIAAVANMFGVWLVMGTLAGLVFLFTAFWIPIAAIDDVGASRALSRSISFVKNNFKTTLGIAGLYIIATAFTGAIFPGGGGGGGGGGLSGAYSFTLVIPPPLQAIFQLLIWTFFPLYMFVVYADKKAKPPQ